MKPWDEVWVRGELVRVGETNAGIRLGETSGVLIVPKANILPAAPPDVAALAREIRKKGLHCENVNAWTLADKIDIHGILRALAACAEDEQSPRAERMEYHFRRFRGNQLMAEEVYVHAYSEEEARAKALLRYDSAEDMGRLELVGTTAKGVAAMGGEG